MDIRNKLKQKENWIIALAVTAVLCLLAGFRFDFFYDLNDDVLMKDILAGVYTGTPEGHNIQMLWLVSAFISLFYRMAGSLPWYGIFLCTCHLGCFFLILKRSLAFSRTFWGKLAVALTEALLFGALFLEHLVFAQYTVTCTFLAAAAAFLFYTTDIELAAKAFIKKNIPVAFLVFTAYLIRSEMLLLVLPIICVAGAAKWGSEAKIFTKEHAVKYLAVIGMILAGIALGQLTHMAAYSSQEWKSFTEFFNNRTELYDFQEIPSYEENRAFYESIGLTESEKVLFDNYNFGLDEEIDESMVGQIAQYAGENRKAEKPFLEKLPEKLKDYLYRFLSGRGKAGSDYPWNWMVLLGYGAAFVSAIPRKYTKEQIQQEGRMTYVKNLLGVSWKLLFLFAVRTALWMFILMRERAPERITHSLYLMEFCILAAFVFAQYGGICYVRTRKLLGAVLAAGFAVLAIGILPGSIEAVSDRQVRREEVNGLYRALYDHLSSEEKEGNFYLIDVYSSVSYGGEPYSEKMFVDVDNSLDNYDIMGGWACKSPLQTKKFANFGIENMEQALREREDVYFVRMKSEDMQWLFDYYKGHGTPIQAELVETIADTFEIYAVSAAER
ncbi:MAG: hypothetical protein HFI44_07775 [Lachnospiraceae bacterium]|nr:hypothetical protein [Lachnospiraceae bacterium]